MKRTVLILAALILGLSVSAQRRGRRVQTPTYTVTPEEAMAVYNFSLAEEILESQIADLTKRKQPTDREEEMLEAVHKLQLRLRATEQVTIIDSVLLPKAKVLSAINLSEENGRLLSYSDFFKTDDADATVFLNELGNHVVYAEPDKNGRMRLKEKSLIGGEWTMERQLTGFEEEDDDNLNFPFMLSDGVTMYYAAECGESLGGYDIFMTRYDSDSQQFLAPENVGMPFNSPANDYLMVIDDFLHLGWFVTDRYQSADTVCVYTFIPTETRSIYNEEVIGTERLASLARIAAIRDTWRDKEAVTAARQRLAEARDGRKAEAKQRDFVFVINDRRTAYTLADFRNKEAQQKAKTWVGMQKDHDTKTGELSVLRAKYASLNDAQRQQIAPQIRLSETALLRLSEEKLALEKEIRRLEVGASQ